MDCQELKIWIEKAGDDEILSPGSEVSQHLSSCDSCRKEYSGIFDSFQLMEKQRKSELPEFTSDRIVSELINYSSSTQSRTKTIWLFSKAAAVVVISVGILAGIAAGNLLSNSNQTEENPWSAEFSSLNEETDYYSYLFD